MRRPTVLAYHSVGECPLERDPHRLVLPIETFEAQMEFLARHRSVVPVSHVVENTAAGEKPAVAITFDDGYRGVLEHAAPILARYGFPSVAFVPTGWIGAYNSWDSFDPGDCRLDVMTEAELHQVEEMGIRVESHGHRHSDLEPMRETEAFADLEESQERFAEVMGRRARYLAYPYGRGAPPSLRSAAERAGFEAAFTVNKPSGDGPFAHGRVVVRREDSLRFFALKTSGRYLSIRHSKPGQATARVIRLFAESSVRVGAD